MTDGLEPKITVVKTVDLHAPERPATVSDVVRITDYLSDLASDTRATMLYMRKLDGIPRIEVQLMDKWHRGFVALALRLNKLEVSHGD